jgi:hypothetical protein
MAAAAWSSCNDLGTPHASACGPCLRPPRTGGDQHDLAASGDDARAHLLDPGVQHAALQTLTIARQECAADLDDPAAGVGNGVSRDIICPFQMSIRQDLSDRIYRIKKQEIKGSCQSCSGPVKNYNETRSAESDARGPSSERGEVISHSERRILPIRCRQGQPCCRGRVLSCFETLHQILDQFASVPGTGQRRDAVDRPAPVQTAPRSCARRACIRLPVIQQIGLVQAPASVPCPATPALKAASSVSILRTCSAGSRSCSSSGAKSTRCSSRRVRERCFEKLDPQTRAICRALNHARNIGDHEAAPVCRPAPRPDSDRAW